MAYNTIRLKGNKLTYVLIIVMSIWGTIGFFAEKMKRKRMD